MMESKAPSATWINIWPKGHVDAQKEQAEAGQGLPVMASFPRVTADLQGHAYPDQRQRKGLNIDLEADQHHQPSGHGGPEITAVDDRKGAFQAQQPRVDESQGGHCDRAGGLHDRGDQGTGTDAAQGRAGPVGEDALQSVPGGKAQAIGHQAHAEEKQTDATQ